MELQLYNTDGRSLQPFIPIQPPHVGLYCCGPTVYNYAHIGNLRTYVFEDLLRRILERFGYSVTHVMNITDVGHLTDDGDDGEDKMIKSARERGMSVWDIARFFTDAFFNDTRRLNILPPSVACRATEHIPEMIALVQTLLDKGYAYRSGGNVYFDIASFPDYGKMARLDGQTLQAGSRVGVDSNKRHPHDFALWFTDSKFGKQAMSWESPWGRGYPGWHVECSAMSMKYLGDHFDIHCGGIDHIPVHHTNEIAQSEAASGHRWVNYWIHGEFLVLNKAKMSKSLNGFITLQTLIDNGYDPLDYRYFLLGGHYRSQLQFGYEALQSARSSRLALEKRLRALKAECGNRPADRVTHPELSDCLASFDADCADDMNIPKALSRLYSVFKIDAPPAEKLAVIDSMDAVLGLSLVAVTADGESESGEEALPPESAALIREREEARRAKDWARSDLLRERLLQQGIAVQDGPNGTRWEKIKP